MDKQVTAKARRDHRRKMAAKRANELKIKAQKKEWVSNISVLLQQFFAIIFRILFCLCSIFEYNI